MGCICTKPTKPTTYELPGDLPETHYKPLDVRKSAFYSANFTLDLPPLLPETHPTYDDKLLGVRKSAFYSANFKLDPPPLLPAVIREPRYNLLCLVEFSDFSAYPSDFYNKEDMRSKYSMGTFEIKLSDYLSAGTHTACSVAAACEQHIHSGTEPLELVVINEHLDDNDEKYLGKCVVDIAAKLDECKVPSLTLNFIQIRRSKRLSGNFAYSGHPNGNCLEELVEIWKAKEPRLAGMLNAHTASKEYDDLSVTMTKVLELIEERHHVFDE